MTTYDVPDEILVESEGPIRVITLNRPAARNILTYLWGESVPRTPKRQVSRRVVAAS